MKSFCVFICFFAFTYVLNSSNIYHLNFKTETSIIVPSLFLGSYSLFQANKQTTLSYETIQNLSVNSINKFDRRATQNFSPFASKISDYLLIACLIAPFTLNMDKNIQNEYREIGVISTETFLLTTSLVTFSKTKFQRNRPYVYNENVDIKIRQKQDSQYSFFSWHTALAFAGGILTATIYDDIYPDKNNFWIYATTITTASTVGYLRYKAGKHFPSDVVVGAIVGTGAALFLTHIHKESKASHHSM